MDIDLATRGAIKALLLPPGVLLVALLIGWIFARSFFGRFVLFAAIVSFYAMTTSVFVQWLAGHVEVVPPPTNQEIQRAQADAILVFLGGRRRVNPELDGADTVSAASLERVTHALLLHRQTDLPIVLSGGSLRPGDRPVAKLAADWLIRHTGVSPLAVEGASRNTRENAEFSAELLKARGIQRVLLVTHAAHMPRSRLSAELAGIDAVAAPMGFEHSPPPYTRPMDYRDWLPSADSLAASYRLLHEIAGLFWYGLTHD